MRSNTLSILPFCLAVMALVPIASFGQAIPARPVRRPDQTKTQPATRPCTLMQATLPKIGGVQMGSTYDDVLSLYPEIADDKHFQKRLEEDNGGLTYIKVTRVLDEPEREQPVAMSLFFVERVVAVIAVESAGLEDFKSIKEAVTSYSRFLGISQGQWTIQYGYAGILKCDGFSFYANAPDEDNQGANSISIHADVKTKLPR